METFLNNKMYNTRNDTDRMSRTDKALGGRLGLVGFFSIGTPPTRSSFAMGLTALLGGFAFAFFIFTTLSYA